MIDENQLLRTIVLGSDWNEVLTTIVFEDGMDPRNINIIKLTESFVTYLHRLKSFDFRIPARFILIAAILLRMKCELLMTEEKEEKEKGEELPSIDITKVPLLEPPMVRKPTRNVTLDELVTALNKALDYKEHKEKRKLMIRKAVENLIETEEDIEKRIEKILRDIATEVRIGRGSTTFSKIVPRWKRREIVSVLVPLLHLSRRGDILCEQEEPFSSIIITLRAAQSEPLAKDL